MYQRARTVFGAFKKRKTNWKSVFPIPFSVFRFPKWQNNLEKRKHNGIFVVRSFKNAAKTVPSFVLRFPREASKSASYHTSTFATVFRFWKNRQQISRCVFVFLNYFVTLDNGKRNSNLFFVFQKLKKRLALWYTHFKLSSLFEFQSQKCVGQRHRDFGSFPSSVIFVV